MRAGILLTFQNLHKDMTDEDVARAELTLAESAEDLGFDTIWSVEHHFDDYAMCPDNFTYLAYLAGRTSTIKIATGAVILPWNDPLRVAEKAVMLDYLTNGRFILGLGRGLARMEYEGFGIPMSEARERFDEGSAMVVSALESGTMEGHGKYYPQPLVTLRPAPTRSFADRLVAVGASPDSVSAAARIGAALMAFIQQPIELHAAAVHAHRDEFIALHGHQPDIPRMAQQMYCHSDAAVAEEMAYRHIGRYLQSVFKHYEFGGQHFATTKGYESYDAGSKAIRDVGEDAAIRGFVDLQLWGTPDQILDRLRAMKELMGNFETIIVPSYAEMSPDQTRASVELFGKEVVPELHTLSGGVATPPAAVVGPLINL